MSGSSRRTFLKTTAVAGAGALTTGFAFSSFAGAPGILTSSRRTPRTDRGRLVFRPQYVQRGRGPHMNWAYASDENQDAFHSNVDAPENGVLTVSDVGGRERFGVNVRWNVEGFGYLFLTADNAGRYYALPDEGSEAELNLNVELAHSRVARNRRRLEKHTSGTGWSPSRTVAGYLDLSEGYLEDALRPGRGEETRAEYAQTALRYALHASEGLEVEYAQYAIGVRGRRADFFLGCDAKAYYLMNPDLFFERFNPRFNFANVTFVPEDSVMGNFETGLGEHNFGRHDLVIRELNDRNIPAGGRLLFWYHDCCTPEWLRSLSYDRLKAYVEKHTREVVRHYGDRVYFWELANEMHDWANAVHATPEQAVELTKIACEVAKAEQPNVHRFINHCCPFAEYVQMNEWSSGQPAQHPQRTPWQFTKDLVDAGVDFTMIGQQMYFPYRDMQDMIMLVERYETFDLPIQVSEIGVTSGPTKRSVLLEELPLPDEPYAWHRHWDDELQADWMERLYTLLYANPQVEAANWFDLVDHPAYIRNGGFLRGPEGEPKPVYHRLEQMQERWNSLPEAR